MFFAIVFFIIAGIVLQGKTYIYNYVTTECQNPVGYFANYDRVHVIADTYACSPQCPCNAGKLMS
jgi:hypothetical protein